ncbi:MAG: Acyl-CoA dehydrogenase type 2 domain protein [Agromyces sp.]|jgi:alkylation response protein AidB-like acyl-CoA dehydrogenase|nr:Acyl-CoA dehydrogenase type 2 domain protein [Agromyces sp.]
MTAAWRGLPLAETGAAVSDDELFQRFQPIFDRIAEGAVERERERRLALDEVGWLREAGFGAVRIPRAAGGGGASLRQLFRLLVALGRADSNLPQALRQHFFHVELLILGDGLERNRELIARVVDGDLFGNATTEAGDAVLGRIGTRIVPAPDGDGYLLSGKKFYSTGNLYAQWVPVAAVDEHDAPVSVLVPRDRAGVVVYDDWRGFGQRLTASGTTEFHDVRVAASEVVRVAEPGSILGAGFHQLVLLATLAGIAGAASRDSVRLVQARKRVHTTGPGVLPVADPIVQQSVGQSVAAEVQAAALVDATAEVVEEAWRSWNDEDADAARTQELFVRAELVVAAAQAVVVPVVIEATARLFDTLGASALDEGQALDRHWRNARTVSSHNPHLYKARMLGDFALNGTLPQGFQAGSDVGRLPGA